MAMMKNTVLDQYLKIATFGNVVSEHAVAANRWRLACKHCGVTLTFAEFYDIAEAYAKDGRLDAGVQEFAKEHRHLVPSHQNKFGNIVYEPAKKKEPTKTPDVFVPADTAAMLEKFDGLKNDLAKQKALQTVFEAQRKLLKQLDDLKNGKLPEPLPQPKRQTEGRKFR